MSQANVHNFCGLLLCLVVFFCHLEVTKNTKEPSYHLVSHKSISSTQGSRIYVNVSVVLDGDDRVIRFLVDSGHSYIASLPESLCQKYKIPTKPAKFNYTAEGGQELHRRVSLSGYELVIYSLDKLEEFDAVLPFDCIANLSQPILGLVGMESFGAWKIVNEDIYVSHIKGGYKILKMVEGKTESGKDFIYYEDL